MSIKETEMRNHGTVECVVCERFVDLTDQDNPIIKSINSRHYHSQCGEYAGWRYLAAIRYASANKCIRATVRDAPGGTFIFEGLSRTNALKLIAAYPDTDLHIMYGKKSEHPGWEVYIPHMLLKATKKWKDTKISKVFG